MMEDGRRRRFGTCIRLVASLALCAASPGLAGYQAAAQIVAGSAAGGVPVAASIGADAAPPRTAGPELDERALQTGLIGDLAAPAASISIVLAGDRSAEATAASRLPAAASSAALAAGTKLSRERPATASMARPAFGATDAKPAPPRSAQARPSALGQLWMLYRARPRAGANLEGDGGPVSAASTPAAPRLSGLSSSDAAGARKDLAPAPAENLAVGPAKPADSGTFLRKWARRTAPALILAGAFAFAHAHLLPAAFISGSLLLSVLLHESAHLWGLRRWGDPTPGRAGRGSLNPLRNIDIMGTILAPMATLLLSSAAIGFPVLFGWAKPVPVDFNKLPNPKKDAAKVALLGPAMNLALAGLAGAALLALPAAGLIPATSAAALALSTLFKMNLALAAFNLIPIPSLDGGKILVALFPKGLYERWTRNPKLPGAYQGIFRRIYEGPANLLSRLHVRDLGRVNGLTRLASLAALGVFYGLFFTTLHMPLLFLALPCTYDYWCIHEKVRSDAAVGEIRGLMLDWTGVILQIAEDLGARSAGDAFETEHALKNAVEDLADKLMDDDSFRGLSRDEKLAKFLEAYPEFALKYLKDKAFPGDAEELVRKILNDAHNAPYYERLGQWFKNHDIFDKWRSPLAKKTLKSGMDEKKNVRTRSSGGGFAAALLLPLMLLSLQSVFPHLSASGPLTWLFTGFLGIFGTVNMARPGNAGPAGKIRAKRSYAPGEMWVQFDAGVPMERIDAVLDSRRLAKERILDTPSGPRVQLRLEDAAAVETAARALQEEPAVTEIAVDPDAAARLSAPEESQAPAPANISAEAAAKKIRANREQGPGGMWVYFVNGVFRDEIDGILRRRGLTMESYITHPAGSCVRLLLGNAAAVETAARALQEEPAVTYIEVHPDSAARLRAPKEFRPPVTAPADISPEAAAEKIRAADGRQPTEIVVYYEVEGVRAVGPIEERHGLSRDDRGDLGHSGGKTYVLYRFADEGEAALKARELAADEQVRCVEVAPETKTETKIHRDDGIYGSEIISVFRAGSLQDAAAIEARHGLSGRRQFPGARAGDTFVIRYLLAGPALAEQKARELAADERVSYVVTPRIRATQSNASVGAQGSPQSAQPSAQDPPPPSPSVQPEDKPNSPYAQPAAPADAGPAPPRDAAATFNDFLNHHKLADGTTLKPAQVKLLLRFLKPVVYKPQAPSLPVIARAEEIKKAVPILTSPRGMRNSVLLVGEAGVGKTAVLEGIAQLIEEAERSGSEAAPYLDLKRLKGRWLLEFNIDELLSPGQDEDPVALFKAVIGLAGMLNDPDPKRGNALLLMFDEIHKLFMDPAGRKLANYLKGPLRDGLVSVAATLTSKEYKEFIEPDDAFRRRFEKIDIKEPTPEQTVEMLRGLKPRLEARHDAVIPDETLVAAAKLSHQFDKDNFLPAKAINLVEDAAELARPENLRTAVALDIREVWRKLELAIDDARRALLGKAIPSAMALPADLHNRVAGLAKEATRLYEELSAVKDGAGAATPDTVKRRLTEKTGIQAGQLTLGQEDASRYVGMESELGARVINQEAPLKAISNAIRRNKAAIGNENRPIGKFLMVGPTGVGKTHIAKELARFLFHDPNAMIRFDMSEFMAEHAYMRLVGAPPSYVGFEEGGQLTEAVRKQPYSVVLLDEIEKAHPQVLNVLLQILDDGRLTDGRGRTVDFKNTVFLMTSNAGMEAVDSEKYERLLEIEADPLKRESIEKRWDEDIRAAVKESIRARIRPELLNRLDQNPDSKEQWIVLNRLNRKNVKTIARLQLDDFTRLLLNRHDIQLELAEEVFELLARRGFSPAFGARPMESAIEKLIKDPLANWILSHAKTDAEKTPGASGSIIRVGVAGDATTFREEPKPAAAAARQSLEGAAARLASALLDLIEKTAEHENPAPGPDVFDRILRALLKPAHQAAPSAVETEAAAETATAVFHADTPLQLPAEAMAAQAAGNDAGLKDDNLLYAAKGILEEAADKGWPPEILSLIDSGHRSAEGWLKQFVRRAKTQATGGEEPVSVTHAVSRNAIRILIHRGGGMEPREKELLAAHFSGSPPKDLAHAQAEADRRALGGAMLWNHYLLDLYRRLSETPGARAGFVSGERARGGRGTDYWLELVRRHPEDQIKPEPDDERLSRLTPHQLLQRAKIKELMLGFIRQDKLDESDKDGAAVMLAAAEGFARLAVPEDVFAARGWIREKGWTNKSAKAEALRKDRPLLLTASLVLERFGNPLDIPILEEAARKYEYVTHDDVPVHTAMRRALSALYKRAGLGETRAALQRGSDERNIDIKEAALAALGTLGQASDYDAVKNSPEALLSFLKRADPAKLETLLSERWPPPVNADGGYDRIPFNKLSDGQAITVLKAVGEKPVPSQADLAALEAALRERLTSERVVIYSAARAWADVVVRLGRTQGLTDAFKRFLDNRPMTDAAGWASCLALIYALGDAGTPDALGELEQVMEKDPASIKADYEQPYFETAPAWARIVARHGLLPELSRPKTGPDGAPRPSKLQEMLSSKQPLLAAAALYAVALSQEASENIPAAPPPASGPVPDILSAPR